MNLQPILKTASVFLIALFISLTVNAQVWNTVGNGLLNGGVDPFGNPLQTPQVTTSDTNGVYVVSYKIGPPTVAYLERWNGTLWNAIQIPSPISSGNSYTITDIAVIGNNIYISSSSSLSVTPILKFDGTTWSTLTPPGFLGYVQSLSVINGDLVCGGSFTANGGIDKLMRFDGTNFIAYPALSWLTGIYDVLEFNNELYISGSNSQLIKPIDSMFLKLNSFNIWEGPASFSQATGGSNSVFKMIEYQNKIHFIDTYSTVLYKLEADSINLIYICNHPLTAISVFNNELYLSGAGGPGYSGITKYDGSTFSILLDVPNQPKLSQVFNQELYVFSTNMITYNGVIHNRAFRTDGVFPVIQGKTFLDSNNNCVLDTLESHLANTIMILDGNFYYSANSNGQYSFYVTAGTHSIDTVYSPFINYKNVKANCTPIVFPVAFGQTVTNDIGFNNVVFNDATVKLTAFRGWRALYGFTEKYTLEVSNTGTNNLSVLNLNIQIPNTLLLDSVSVTPSSQVQNLISFQINNLQPYKTAKIDLFAIIDTGMNSLNDSIQWNMWLDPIAADLDQSDNTDTLKQIVVGAYDPNDKTASAEYISPTTKRIDYHIRFQNTGTDTAYKVVVVDTLNTSLALTNVVINSASHPYNFSVVNNILVWEFDNILLPDSGADYAGSQGYVNFSTGINPALSLGDSVTNDADIYFDFQKPVITNTAKTTIVNNISVVEQTLPKRVLEVYPNPARDLIRIKNTSNADLKAQLTNTSGQVIRSFSLKPSEELSYECSNLPAGMYILSTQFESYKILITD